MQLLKVVAVVFVFLFNLAIAQPVLADPIAEKSPEYTEITQSLTQLLQAQKDPEAAGYSAADLQNKILSLQFQKYVMETSEDWGVCQNNTNKTLAIYGHQPKKPYTTYTDNIYYLAPGEATDSDWDCSGVYLPNDAKVAGLDLGGAGAVKITDGSYLTISSDPTTNEIQFNLPLASVFKAGEGTWTIPDLAQADIDAQAPNAPTD